MTAPSGRRTSSLEQVTRETPTGAVTGLRRPGEGAPIVVVHGVMADAAAWTRVVDALAPRRPAMVLNRRGRSPSSPLDADYSLDTEVEDLVAWLELEDRPADLVAHSYGGLVAVEAVRRGVEVRSLVLYEPVARPFAGGALPRLTAALERGDLDAAVEIINVDLSGYSREHVADLRAGPHWDRLRRLAVPAGQELAAIEAFGFEEHSYAGLGVPVTLVAGELSRHRPPYGPSVDRYRAALGVDDVTLLAGHDHLAHVTGPVELAWAIERGLRS